ncbi:MAG: bi-domain-containing oxidoreductase [Candidatus Hydrogenedentes bacterium]|nr:bi-domain-containing oxidoreductase [Candidatus Hydrogenedentota bacterium]
MKQVLFDKGAVLVEDVPAPVVADGMVLVETACSLISVGTELAGMRGSGESIVSKALRQPEKVKKALRIMSEQGVSTMMKAVKSQVGQVIPVGYSCAGTVIDVGDGVMDIKKGDRVACAGAGYANHAEIVNVPRNLVVKLPDNVSFADGCSATVGAIALQGVRRADNRLGETVAVIGLGLLGQITVQLLKSAGCRVCAIDIDGSRVEMAERFGADFAINSANVDPVEQLDMATHGHGADSTIITAASSSNFIAQQAMEMTRKKGKVVVVGAVGLGVNRSPFYEKEIDFLISCSYGPGRYDAEYEVEGHDYPFAYVRWTENRNMQAYLGLLSAGDINFKDMVCGTYEISDAPAAYASFNSDDKPKPLAVLLEYKRKDPDKFVSKIEIVPSMKVAGRIGVGVIGAGSFAQAFHLPHIKKLADRYNLVGVSDVVGSVARNAADKFGAGYATTDYKEMLTDDAIDLIVITTRHNLHSRLAIEAARAGKAVLCEKPMAMNRHELDELVEVIKETQTPYMVGFNRRFSPAAAAVKKALDGISAGRHPLVINYRVNGEHLPPDLWVFGPEGGGRVIGEACHMFDFFNFFTESTVETLDVRGIFSHDEQSPLRDNFSAIVNYANGDVCTLTYTSIGGPRLGKEFVEIHCGGTSFVIDNFKTLAAYGVRGVSLKSRASEKGHLEELIALSESLKRGENAPIPLDHLVAATEISFAVAETIS